MVWSQHMKNSDSQNHFNQQRSTKEVKSFSNVNFLIIRMSLGSEDVADAKSDLIMKSFLLA